MAPLPLGSVAHSQPVPTCPRGLERAGSRGEWRILRTGTEPRRGVSIPGYFVATVGRNGGITLRSGFKDVFPDFLAANESFMGRPVF